MVTLFQSLSFNLAVLPFMVALITALVGIFWQVPSAGRRTFFAFSAVIQVLLSIYIFTKTSIGDVVFLPVGGWKPPFGIAITIDLFSSLFLIVTTFLVLIASLYTFVLTPANKEQKYLMPLIQFMAAGIILSFSTGDFFNLFVSFEIFLIASYALLTLSSKTNALKRTLPYLGINVLGGTLFVVGAAFVYGFYGTLNFASIAAVTASMAADPKLVLLATYLVLVFGIKAGFFPMFYWLPRAYSSLPAPVAALFAGLLTKVGIYAIVRTLVTIFPSGFTSLYDIVGLLSIFTMVVPIVISLSRKNIREILCYNLVSHIGFLMVAIAVFTRVSMTGVVYYMLHHMIVISSLFLIGGLVIQVLKTDDLESAGGLWKKHGFLGLLFFLQALSLAGLPPFSGFWGKFLIVKSLITLKHNVLLTALIIASILTLLSMIRIWFHVFLKKNEQAEIPEPPKGFKRASSLVSVVVLVSLTMGIYSNWFIETSFNAVQSLNNKRYYLQKVLTYKQTLKKADDHGKSHSSGKKSNKHGASHKKHSGAHGPSHGTKSNSHGHSHSHGGSGHSHSHGPSGGQAHSHSDQSHSHGDRGTQSHSGKGH